MNSGLSLSHMLRSLVPTNHEELSQLRYLITCAQLVSSGAHLERSLVESPTLVLADTRGLGLVGELSEFLTSLSDEAKRLFHGLVEALEIHRSIHGQPLVAERLTLSDQTVYELKQIRDMCLEDGLHSIY